jgi:predicted DNA-binding protein
MTKTELTERLRHMSHATGRPEDELVVNRESKMKAKQHVKLVRYPLSLSKKLRLMADATGRSENALIVNAMYQYLGLEKAGAKANVDKDKGGPS